ncbi:MAG TPA: hypothetical protein VGS10_11470 [Terracidiphilus sp.]|nr:hypothetical protein [Terracidiphilus sp.]
MDEGIEVTFDTSKLVKALDAMPAKMQRKHLRAGVKAGAQPILKRMQAKCPVEHESPTPKSTALGPGVLKASLRVKITSGKNGVTAMIGAPEGTGHVAYWLEKGFDHTGHKRIKRGRGRQLPPNAKVKHIPGTYFMQGAADEAAQQAVDAMVEAIAESIGSDTE